MGGSDTALVASSAKDPKKNGRSSAHKLVASTVPLGMRNEVPATALKQNSQCKGFIAGNGVAPPGDRPGTSGGTLSRIALGAQILTLSNRWAFGRILIALLLPFYMPPPRGGIGYLMAPLLLLFP